MINATIEAYYPIVGYENGKYVGMDVDILNAAAKVLHQTVHYSIVDFPGQLAGVQTHRNDVAIGAIGWNPTRAQVGIFTDPTYYEPTSLAEKCTSNITTVTQMEGKVIGTAEGFEQIPAIQAIPGATLRTYPTDTAAYPDIENGRVAAGLFDPLTNLYAIRALSKSSGLCSDNFVPPTAAQLAAHPAYLPFYPPNMAFYIPKQETRLEVALSKAIDTFYTNGTEAKILKEWGADPSVWLTPGCYIAGQRHAVDRPASWVPPSWPTSGKCIGPTHL